jgi:hypothetical protein
MAPTTILKASVGIMSQPHQQLSMQPNCTYCIISPQRLCSRAFIFRNRSVIVPITAYLLCALLSAPPCHFRRGFGAPRKSLTDPRASSPHLIPSSGETCPR